MEDMERKVVEILRDCRGSLIMCEDGEWKQFVCCTGFDNDSGTWLSGEYFETLDDAMDCFHNRMKRNRLEELARMVVDGLLCDDEQPTIDYLWDEARLTLSEARFLGVPI